jgi:hypothetical protein
MVEQKPTNLFSSNTFISLVIVVLSAAQPNIVDISKNGGTFEKYFSLMITLFGAFGVTADKIDKEKNVYTPKWFPLGRNPEDAEQSTVLAPVKEVAEIDSKSNDTVAKVESVLKAPLNLLKLK